MKKTMAKVLSVVCTVALVLSLCTFGVMAEESVLDALTAEKLAVSGGVYQLPTSIVQNLTLSQIDGVTWESSNPTVLANDGTVTRPVVEDANVTLKAKTVTEEKAFNFTVKAGTTDVLLQDSFAYASLDDFIAINDQKPWWSYGNEVAASLLTDADGNQYAAFDFETSGALKKKTMDVQADIIYLDFDIKADKEKDIMLQIQLAGTKVSDGTPATTAFNLTRFYKGTARPAVYEIAKSFGEYDGTKFVHYSAKIDMVNKQFWVKFGDNDEIGPFTVKGQKSEGVDDFETYDINKMVLLQFTRSTTSVASGIVNLDNFVVSTKKSVDEFLPTLTAEKQLDYVIGDLEERFPLTDNAALSAKTLALPTYGGIVSWTDANGSALGESVTLTQNDVTFNAGKLVATITPTGEGDTTPKTYTYAYSVLPKNLSVRTRATLSAAFNFDNGWVAPTTMNNTFHTGIEFKVFGASDNAIPTGVTWTAVSESEAEVANKVGKFVNGTNVAQTVAIDATGSNQSNMRMQIGADFKLAEGNKATILIDNNSGYPPVTIPMDFESGKFTLKERSNDVEQGNNPDLIYTYNLADYGVTSNSWNRIEIDYSTVGFVYDVYLNGTKVNSTPLNFGNVTGNGIYWANTFRFLKFEVPTASTLLLDNVTIAESEWKGDEAILDGAARRLEKNFASENAFSNGETLYNDFKDTDFFPGSAYVDGTNDNSDQIATPQITWKLDGVDLDEAGDRVPLSFTGMGTHTLEATITYNDKTATKTFTITGAPVALKVLDTNMPGVKLGTDVSGKLIVAKYTDDTMKILDSVKIYNYVNGVNQNGAFNQEDKIVKNSKLFFFNDNLAPLAFNAIK